MQTRNTPFLLPDDIVGWLVCLEDLVGGTRQKKMVSFCVPWAKMQTRHLNLFIVKQNASTYTQRASN